MRIVTICDSCHSGTNTQAKFSSLAQFKVKVPTRFQHNTNMKAMLIHMGACRDSQEAEGGDETTGSVYTSTLYEVWRESIIGPGSYYSLHQGIVDKFKYLAGDQDPQYNEYGSTNSKEFEVFRSQEAFEIKIKIPQSQVRNNSNKFGYSSSTDYRRNKSDYSQPRQPLYTGQFYSDGRNRPFMRRQTRYEDPCAQLIRCLNNNCCIL